MISVPFINDFWQFRMNRLSSSIDEERLTRLSEDYWQSLRQDKHIISSGNLEFEIHTFDKGLVFTDAFVDLAILPEPYMHKFRLLAGHSGVRTALADAGFRKVIAVIPGNIRDLTRDELAGLCQETAGWLDAAGGLYISPFSQSADIFRNWKKGVYTGGATVGEHNSLFALERLMADRRSLMIETCNALMASAVKGDLVSKNASIQVAGAGLWAESIAVSLGLNGFKVEQVHDQTTELRAEVIILADAGVRIGGKEATSFKDRIIIELFPDQIDPSADKLLSANNRLVVPSIAAAAAEELVEKWLLTGEQVDTWEHYLHMTMNELVESYRSLQKKRGISDVEALLLLAMERLEKCLFGD